MDPSETGNDFFYKTTNYENEKVIKKPASHLKCIKYYVAKVNTH